MFYQPIAKPTSAPNNRTKINPEITGDTENGRSIKVVNKLLPLNSKRVIARPRQRQIPCLMAL